MSGSGLIYGIEICYYIPILKIKIDLCKLKENTRFVLGDQLLVLSNGKHAKRVKYLLW